MDVILYVMDALRADALSCFGNEYETSPVVDSFAEDAVTYTNAYSTSTWTKAAATSLFTSRHPRALGMVHQMDVLPAVDYSLSTVLSERGFESYAVSANTFVSEEFGFTGFDDFTLLQRDPAYQERRRSAKKIRENDRKIMDRLGLDEIVTPLSADVNDRLFEILEDTADTDTFVTAWSIDTHGPYFVRGDSSEFGNSQSDMLLESEVNADNLEKARSLYRDMVRYNDEQFGHLLDRLRAAGRYEDALVILVADHGEGFGEHTSFLDMPIVGHNSVAYEELVHIPMLVKYPGGRWAGTTEDALTQLLDVHPTVTDVCGVERPDPVQGRSLVPSSNELSDDRTLFMESHPLPDQVYTGAVRRGPDKLITVDHDIQWGTDVRQMAGSLLWKYAVSSPQLYDLDADPDERDDLAADYPDLASNLQRAFESRRDELDEAAESVGSRHLDGVAEDTERHLTAMGYLE
ncbi:MAG: sulfatase [Halapricum sp.]